VRSSKEHAYSESLVHCYKYKQNYAETGIEAGSRAILIYVNILRKALKAVIRDSMIYYID